MNLDPSYIRYAAFFIVMIFAGYLISIALNPNSSIEQDKSTSDVLSSNTLAKTAPNGAILPSISPEDTIITYRIDDGSEVLTSSVSIDVEGGIEFIFDDMAGETKIRQFDDQVSYLFDPITETWQELDNASQAELLPDVSLITNQTQLDSFNSLATFVDTQDCGGLSCSVWEVGSEDAGAVYRVVNLTKKIYDFTSVDVDGNVIGASYEYKSVDVKFSDMVIN